MQAARAITPHFATDPLVPVLQPVPLRGPAPPPLPRQADLSRIDAAELARLGPLACLRAGHLPLMDIGHRRVCAVSRAGLPDAGRLGQALPCPDLALQQAILSRHGAEIAERAARLRPGADSCRTLRAPGQASVLALLSAVLALGLLAPQTMAGAMALVAIGVVLVTMGFKLVLWLAAIWPDPPKPAPRRQVAPLPQITLLVPLLREGNIAAGLIRALARLHYPRDRLEILLLVEQGDAQTLTALRPLHLSAHIRVVLVPEGAPRTKPRALNHGLALSRGAIIGIYDAEDHPDPDQLLKVAAGFAAADPRVACLQGRLAFDNALDGPIQRAFALDYGVWFGLLMRGLDRLGLPIPLGGTTVFLRRAALDAVGAWDAHNVTEDADLGLRLARAGYRSALLDSRTGEEALSRPWPWIRQRSRWIKGFVMTWRALMIRPRAALRDLGPAGFVAAQILLLGPVLSLLALPVTLSFWAGLLGGPSPFLTALPDWALTLVRVGFPGLALAQTGLLIAGRPGDWPARRLLWVLPMMPAYHLMGAVAAIKAIWEIGARPHYWDKTAHGHARVRQSSAASFFSRS